MGRVPAELTPADDELVVAEVFGPTFQGEGPSLGRRAGFVRLGRCNLDCVWCDTPYTWDWERFDPAVELRRSPISAVVTRLEEMSPEIVVITGGEPLLQQRRLGPLLDACAQRGWAVEIETNGTIVPDPAVIARVRQWNVSPKLANSGIDLATRIRPDALAAFVAAGNAVFKFVVAATDELDEIDELAEAYGLSPVWVMPEGTDANTLTERARSLAEPVLDRGWNFTPRLHVLLWGDERGR
ncbi:MAG: 7-carboxy-7-deazaguanine synthase QueE [Acidimicrobiales bacterium]